MSALFNVSLDYLLNEETPQQSKQNPDEPGIYVSREMAAGFLAYQKRKMMKIGIAVGLLVGGLSLSFWDAEISMILFMDNPYRKIRIERLSFDKTVKAELAAAYADKKKLAHMLNLIGVALIAIGFLLCPMLVSAELYALDNFIFACGMVLAGTGAFLCVYISGMVRAFRFLLQNAEL